VAVRLLLDENLSERLISALADLFPDVLHVRGAGLGGASDVAVWEFAAHDSRLLVTKDEDFLALSILRGTPPKVVWLNIGNASNPMTEALLRTQFGAIDSFAADSNSSFLALSFPNTTI
jgi:predicted nuclease of predicted toxin-antitoxin system